MIRKIITPILFLFVAFSFAQTPEELDRKFDSIYFDVATTIAGRDVERAFKIADSLYVHKTNDLQGVKVLMLTASLNSQVGNPIDAIVIALEAKKLAAKTNEIVWQARILGFLSTQFRNMSLFEKSKAYLKEAIEVSKKIKDESRRNVFLGLVYQEWSYASIADKDLKKAFEWIDLAQEYLGNMSDSAQKEYLISTNYYLYGKIYLNSGEYELSIENYNKAISLLQDNIGDKELLIGFIYGELGAAFLALKDYTKAKDYLDKSENIAVTSEAVNLKLETYKSLSEYYKTIEDYKNYSIYQEKLINTTAIFNNLQKAAIDKLIQYLDSDAEKMSKNETALLSSLVALTVVGSGLLVFYYRKKKQTAARFKQIIKELRESETISEKTNTTLIASASHVNSAEEKLEHEAGQNGSSKKTINISDKKEKEIFEGLKEFEESNGFIDRNISLATLAGQINTNTIYLSHILNNVYGKDFNLYINELRIKYAISKLTTDKKYRTYKISYLAEEFGFSSHSKFSSVFKAITELTPSVFINHLEKEEQEQEQEQEA